VYRSEAVGLNAKLIEAMSAVLSQRKEARKKGEKLVGEQRASAQGQGQGKGKAKAK
jgi:Flp pilus assembly protein TadB